MRKTHHSCDERAVVITKQGHVSSRMSQSALALDHPRTCDMCLVWRHAHMRLLRNSISAAYYEPGKWYVIYTL